MSTATKTFVKTPEQIEFAEIFERLEKTHQITKADVARALTIERSYVSMLIQGQRTPHLRTLQAMREYEQRLQRERQTAPAPGSPQEELHRLSHLLATMERHDRTSFEAAKKVIETLGAASAKPAGRASRLLKKVSDSLTKETLK